MSKLTPELEALAEEQQRFQFDPESPTTRNRPLTDYAKRFGLQSTHFRIHIQNLISTQPQTVFADFGCGEGVALAQFMSLAEKLGKKDQVRVIGVDILEVDKTVQNQGVEFLQDDIETVTLPSPADLVTLCDVLLWTRDPLAALANAAAQTKIGGLVCANWSERIMSIETFQPLAANFSGFGEVVNNTHKGELVLRKTIPVTDRHELLTNWYGAIPKLERRTYYGPQLGHHYFYSLPFDNL